MATLKTFRVWFVDDSALLVTAETRTAARVEAEKLARDLVKGVAIDRAEVRKATTVRSVERISS